MILLLLIFLHLRRLLQSIPLFLLVFRLFCLRILNLSSSFIHYIPLLHLLYILLLLLLFPSPILLFYFMTYFFDFTGSFFPWTFQDFIMIWVSIPVLQSCGSFSLYLLHSFCLQLLIFNVFFYC